MLNGNVVPLTSSPHSSTNQPVNYQPKLPRWKHQETALQRCRSQKAFALLMEMRTGKTKVILDEFGELEQRGEIRQMLVVAPAGVYRTWVTDARKHLSDELQRRVKIVVWESDASPREKEILERLIKEDQSPKIFLVNIEALSAKVSAQKLIHKLCAVFIRRMPTMMIVDESTTIKNHKANRTRYCLSASKFAARRRILSGLPSPQSPMDLFSQFAFLDPRIIGFEKFNDFRHRYGIVEEKPFGPNGRLIEIVKAYQNLDELQNKIRDYSYRVQLGDCYDLPEKQYTLREVELTKEQKRLYDEMVTYATTVINNAERVTATVVLTQLLRLHQIVVGHTTSDNGVLLDIAENRTGELLALLQEYTGKAIVWCAYDRDIRKLTEVLTKEYGPGSVARFWGGNRNERENEELRFKTDPKCRFMLATAGSGGRGRTWDVANMVVYHSNTFSLEHRMQSEERPQMVGKKDNVLYVDLIARETVEEKIIVALRNKMHLSDAVTGDQWRQWVV